MLQSMLPVGGSGGSGSFQFSTEEQKTNLKWIDGKDIYCKGYELNSISADKVVDSSLTYTKHNIIEAIGHFSQNNGTTMAFPFTSRSVASASFSYFTDSRGLVIVLGSDLSLPITNMKIVVFYTKI